MIKTDGVTASEIKESLQRLRSYIEQENYKGYDPYDALTSPLFKLPFFKQNKSVRFGIQQLVKRSPVNLRPLLRIKKGLNPVTLGLCIQGYTAMARAGIEEASVVRDRCEALINQLEKMIPGNYHGACWGYDFPWEARNTNIPAYQPSVVATGIITNALFRYYQFSGNAKALSLCRSACDFVLNDLNRTEAEDGSICFSYSPFDSVQVFNASLKGARLLVQVYHVTKEPNLLDSAEKAVRFVFRHQQPDGSWFYSTLPKGKWVDLYHTGYILDCIADYQKFSGDTKWQPRLDKGVSFFEKHLFNTNGVPRFFSHNQYPLDCTAAAQAILTLCRFQNRDLAGKAAAHTIQNMQSPEGYFYFRKYRFFTERHSFMRWSNAWMFVALATFMEPNDQFA